MSELVVQNSRKELLPLPAPKQAIEISPATLDDVPWIDGLAKRHRNGLGFQTLGAIEEKIGLGQIIIAKSTEDSGLRTESGGGNSTQSSALSPQNLGYCMATDRYMKHEDVGIVYQMNVEPGHQRGFVGAALLKAQFERSAYGCKLYCCWCAQDLAANKFWEAMGFVPLAYRGGSLRRRSGQAGKGGRIHIFWQKRIREGDQTTPWWYPSQTQGGAMSDRLVFPIPPGTHWSEVRAVVIPREQVDFQQEVREGREKKRTKSSSLSSLGSCLNSAVKPVVKRPPLSGGMCFAPAVVEPAPAPVEVATEKKPREKEPKATCPERSRRKNDPRLVAAAREFKDRWLEHLNNGTMLIESAGKYDVVRAIDVDDVDRRQRHLSATARLLPAA